MDVIKHTWFSVRRLSPFSLSLLIHALIIILFAYITWDLPTPEAELPVAALMLPGKNDDRLRFQDTSQLDSFKTQDRMVYPLPEHDYRPVLPEMQFKPEPKSRIDLDLIGLDAMDQKWLTPSSGRQPLYTGDEQLAGSFSRHVQVLREGGLDVVFVFDSTSSMAQFIKKVKFKIANLVYTLKKLVPTARIGMVAYRDVGDTFVTKAQPLTHGSRALQAFLQGIDIGQGGDYEEAVDEALRVAIDEMHWKKKAKKIILLIGDAPPHRQDMPKALQLIKKFRERMHGVVTVLDARYQSYVPLGDTENSSQVLEAFQSFSRLGGGESARLIDEEKVIRQMVVLVFGSRWEVCLDEFMKNL